MELFDVQADVVKKWEKVLDDKNFLPIEDQNIRYVTAQVMENTNFITGIAQRGGKRLAPKSLLESHALVESPYLSLMESVPTNVMGASSSTPGTGPIDIYDPVLIGMIRRTLPNLMAYDIMGVQPMTGPTGTVFALRGQYESQNAVGVNADLWHKEANTSFSATAAGNAAHISGNSEFIPHVGTSPDELYANAQSYSTSHGFSTTFAEMLGKDRGHDFQEIAMTIDKVNVVAMSRALKTTYSVELAQDLMAIHGLNAEQELTRLLTNTLLFEINRELVRTIYITATIGAQNCHQAGVFNMDLDADGRWLGEKILGLYMQIEFEANEIAKATRFGKGNIVICSSNVASALNASKFMKYSPPEIANSLKVDDTGNTFVGVLNNGMKVYIDPYHHTTSNKHFVCVGYKGAQSWDAGIYYCPYVPLQYAKAIDPHSFQPALGFKTRYGVVANPFATESADGKIDVNKKNRYYRLMAVHNLK